MTIDIDAIRRRWHELQSAPQPGLVTSRLILAEQSADDVPALVREAEQQSAYTKLLAAQLQNARAQVADLADKLHKANADNASHTKAATAWANEVDELRQQVDDLGMYKTRYFEIQTLLDEVLGPNEEDGAGEGIVQDVHLLAAQRDILRPVVEAAKEWAEAYVNPTDKRAGVAEAKLFEAVKALPNEQEPCDICSGYGCPDCRDDLAGVAR